MNIVFFGNTKYSKIVEEVLFKKIGLFLVVTIPDRPLGRKKNLTPNPVKLTALENNIPVVEAEKLDGKVIKKIVTVISNPEGMRDPLTLLMPNGISPASNAVRNDNDKKLQKPDFLVVSDYGRILTNELLELPKYASLNVHHSLLPKYRGPSPAPTAILNGDKISGVSIIRMTNQVDAGPILAQKKYQLKPDETTDSLLTKLNELGAEFVVKVINQYLNGTAKEISQDESKATLTKRFTKKDGYIDLKNPPSLEKIDRMIRAYYPWPNVWSELRIRGHELKIKFLPKQKIQVEGKKPVSYKDFLNGYPEAKEWLPVIDKFTHVE